MDEIGIDPAEIEPQDNEIPQNQVIAGTYSGPSLTPSNVLDSNSGPGLVQDTLSSPIPSSISSPKDSPSYQSTQLYPSSGQFEMYNPRYSHQPQYPVVGPSIANSGPAKQAPAKRRLIKRTWLRRLVKTSMSVVLFICLVAGGLYGYALYRFSQVKKVTIPAIVKTNLTNEGGENIILVGSNALGGPGFTSATNLDVVMMFHLDLNQGTASILSLPPLLEVQLANSPAPESLGEIFTQGPAAIVRAITETFGIPINHYVGIDYAGVSTLVNILGGVNLRFPYPSRDPYSGLNITQSGCQTLDGNQAIELLKSNDFEYLNAGQWETDNTEAIGIAQRQRTLLGVIGSKAVKSGVTNPFEGNRFLGSLVNDVLLDSTYSMGDLFSLVNQLGGTGLSKATTFALPTYVTPGPSNTILLDYEPQAAQSVVQSFLGAATSGSGLNGASNSTTQPSSQVPVAGTSNVTGSSNPPANTSQTQSPGFGQGSYQGTAGVQASQSPGQPDQTITSSQGPASTFFDPNSC